MMRAAIAMDDGAIGVRPRVQGLLERVEREVVNGGRFPS